MELGAFVSLEDISDALPPYEEEVINVEMDPVLAAAYNSLEEDIKAALKNIAAIVRREHWSECADALRRPPLWAWNA